MPVDFEMLLSASPPLYAYSAFTDCRLNPFQTDNAFQNGGGFELSKRNYINAQRFPQCFRYPAYHSDGYSCSQNELCTAESETDDESLPKGKSEKKKRVSFADDKGLSLVDIRFIPECTDSTPSAPDNILSLLTEGVKPGATCEKKWKPSFDQPSYDAEALQRKLDKELISLANVRFLEDNDEVLTGTIRVKNIAFEKDVFLRFTFDRWVSHMDVPATYVSFEDRDEALEKYDTFEFAVDIPYSAYRYQVVEFCACMKSNGVERWDNNGGINYRLVATQNDQRDRTVPEKPQRRLAVYSHPGVRNSPLDIECRYNPAEWGCFPSNEHFW